MRPEILKNTLNVSHVNTGVEFRRLVSECCIHVALVWSLSDQFSNILATTYWIGLDDFLVLSI